MPNIMTDFEHLKGWDSLKLFARQAELKGLAPNGDMRQQSDAALIELLAIARILRTRTSAPKVASSKKASAPTLDAL